MELAEAGGEIALLKRRDVLVLEENDLVCEQRIANLRDLLIVEVPGQIHPFDDRADGGSKQACRELRHERPLHWASQYDCFAPRRQSYGVLELDKVIISIILEIWNIQMLSPLWPR
jgi:hypothetical protein